MEGLEVLLSSINSTEDRSSTNLATVAAILHSIAENISFINLDIVRSTTYIMSDIQSWGQDNSSLETLQNRSSE